MLNYQKGDMFKSNFKYLAHGCNSQGVMGSGVAAIVRKQYPDGYEKYRKYCEKYAGQTRDPLGAVIEYYDEPTSVMLFNMITQANFGSDTKTRYVSYDAIADAFLYVNKNYPGICLAIPKIGAGLGNGNWEIIEKIIIETTKNITVTVFVID
jgi:O-acetyl-ADP-ribose deacetylase (regulator of RNase III)